MITAIIYVGTSHKGEQFNTHLFGEPREAISIGGKTILSHLIRSCLKLEDLSEVLLLGSIMKLEYNSHMKSLVHEFSSKRKRKTSNYAPPLVRVHEEVSNLGTAGSLLYYREQIESENPEALLIINGDVCGDFDFDAMLSQHRQNIKQAKENSLGQVKPIITMMTTEADRQESLNYGCIIENPETHLIEHYVEKPSTFVSHLINCGAYFCTPDLLDLLERLDKVRRLELSPIDNNAKEGLPIDFSLTIDVLQKSLSQLHCYSYRNRGSWWCQVKNADSALYANRRYLKQFRNVGPDCELANERYPPLRGCTIIGNVYIHRYARIGPGSVIGPNVSIMRDCVVGPGVRIKESIIMQGTSISTGTLIQNSIVGWYCDIRSWARVEGTPSEPNPDEKFAKVQNPTLFNSDGKLNLSISVVGSQTSIREGIVILNSLVLHKRYIKKSHRNEIVL